MSLRRVVVTGMGAITPLGLSVEESWKNAVAGVSGIGTVSRFDTAVAGFSTTIAGEVKGFDAERYFEIKELKKVDVFTQYAVAASDEALKDSGILEASYDRTRIGCVLGVGIGGLYVLEKFHQAYLEGGAKKISPFLIPAMITNLAPGNVAIKFGLKGVNFSIQSACTSATHAIGEAYSMIAYGSHDAMVTGGSESAISAIGMGGFCAMKALSTRNDDPTKASRPFDKQRDGFVMSEGSAVLVLEEYEAAKKRGATIYGEVLGYATSCDAYHITSPCADGEGASRCMSGALHHAKLNPTDIDYVNAHGTSTPTGDLAETTAIKTVFGNYAKNGLPVSSTKSVTGHLLGAAGAIEAVYSILAMRDGILPPTINLENPDPGCDLDYVPNIARQKTMRRVMSNSFGFGGTNASIIFGTV